MITTKIQIRNLFGIKEYTQDGGSVELSGKNGVGKTSVIDAIRFALTNKSEREYIVRKGETEGEILIETDTGLRINRKVRTDRVGYKSIKQNGVEVGSPEAFLRDIFTPLQLNPVEFMSMDKKKQNAIILDMIEYSWDMNTINDGNYEPSNCRWVTRKEQTRNRSITKTIPLARIAEIDGITYQEAYKKYVLCK